MDRSSQYNQQHHVSVANANRSNISGSVMSAVPVMQQRESTANKNSGINNLVLQMRDFDLADNSSRNKQRMASLESVVLSIANVLNTAHIKYKLQGSMAQAMHGAAVIQIPGDIDILVSSPQQASAKLIESGLFSKTGGSMLVMKLVHQQTNIPIDLAETGDFGMEKAETVDLDGVDVLNVFETLRSLFLRPERRQKDEFAIMTLVVQKNSELTDEQKTELGKLIKMPWAKKYQEMLTVYTRLLME